MTAVGVYICKCHACSWAVKGHVRKLWQCRCMCHGPAGFLGQSPARVGVTTAPLAHHKRVRTGTHAASMHMSTLPIKTPIFIKLAAHFAAPRQGVLGDRAKRWLCRYWHRQRGRNHQQHKRKCRNVGAHVYHVMLTETMLTACALLGPASKCFIVQSLVLP